MITIARTQGGTLTFDGLPDGTPPQLANFLEGDLDRDDTDPIDDLLRAIAAIRSGERDSYGGSYDLTSLHVTREHAVLGGAYRSETNPGYVVDLDLFEAAVVALREFLRREEP
ncbi:MAG: hypothetical protein JWM98_110 [Thermoleophilia bacterium]|nr:hypothetical protein [Thermoleophilia bacterium]